jgi:oxygen-independent coproporphyrinogen-3 oxidase
MRDPIGARDLALSRDLVARFNTAGPRYTSYPTAPEWKDGFPFADVERLFAESRVARAGVPLSLYAHIPFCHKLCYYCGCNMLVTRNAERVERYLDAVIGETAALAERLDVARREVVQLHWGGGTPTFLDCAQLERLHQGMTRHFRMAPGAEVSIEIHPPVTTRAQLETLAQLGFNRLSLGVQDFDPEVQRAVNRIQPFAQTAAIIDDARALGFRSINIDLMYGLPLQTVERFGTTLDLVKTLAPDRVALFNYAHVPWLKPHQKLIKLAQLPSVDDKLSLFELAAGTLIDAGYRYIGMDHFAAADDELAVAHEQRTLRRNFMGYTTCAESDLHAVGVSSISDLDSAYLQNERDLDAYIELAARQPLPVTRGLELTRDDRVRRDVINTIICHGIVDKAAFAARHGLDFDTYFGDAIAGLAPFLEHDLVTNDGARLAVQPRGRMLLRNLCMLFDAYLTARPASTRRFSRTL